MPVWNIYVIRGWLLNLNTNGCIYYWDDFIIEYKRGIDNKVADALSWYCDKEMLAISLPLPRWLDDIKEEIRTSVDTEAIVSKIASQKMSSRWQFKDGVIYYKHRLYLSLASQLTDSIVKKYHGSSHEGYQKMLHRIRSVFFWLGMKAHVQRIIKACEICQVNKVANTSPNGFVGAKIDSNTNK